ncbi:TrmH family RNA methyltransferase [Piscinibacter sakaiensis]|uniref:TrmH family RNA methyltransferase n=1 Tax=Piscinibacter sakaiensis TaxID=1547922 RepID=UPI0006B41F88
MPAGAPPAPREIRSRANPTYQRLRRLAHEPAAYRREGAVWLEGEHLCQEAVQRGRRARLAVIDEAAWAQPARRALAQTAEAVLCLPAPLMAGLSAMDSAPPIAFELPWSAPAGLRPGRPTVVLDRLQDAGNVGTLLRSAAAFGFEQVVALGGTAALWSPKVLRAGMGAHFALHLVEQAGPEALDGLGLPLLATSSHAPEAIDAVPLPWPCAWLLGHEGQGLAPALQARATRCLRIPQPGGLESLNVAAAASVCFYESARQRGRAGPG